MIVKGQMFEPMLDACPSFGRLWREFAEESERHPDQQPLYYLVLGDLARHLVERFRAGLTDEFIPTFQVVESWLCEGDHYVKEAAVIGLLEGIQNSARHVGIEPRGFVNWFLPETHKWWEKLNKFWDGDPHALRQ